MHIHLKASTLQDLNKSTEFSSCHRSLKQRVHAVACSALSCVKEFFKAVFSLNRFHQSSFYNGLKDFLRQELVSKSKLFSPQLNTAIANFIGSSNFYTLKINLEVLTKTLRNELVQDPDNANLIDFCHNFYLANLHPSFRAYFEKDLKIGSLDTIASLNGESYIDALQKAYKKTKSRMQFGIPTLFEDKLYDARLEGDLPSFMYTMNIGKSRVKVIRTPNATRDVLNSQKQVVSEIAPEFEAFLKKGQRHLYVNLMVAGLDEHESRRSQRLHDLEKDHDNVFVVTLDKNLSFYYQKDQFQHDYLVKDFKAHFMEELRAQKAFKFPRVLLEDQTFLNQEVPAILNQVHEEFFENFGVLSHQKRREFIDLVYCALIEKIAEKLQVETLNTSCKSTVDRGAAQLCMLHAYHNRHNQPEIDKKLMAVLAFAPAIANMNRVMIPDRFEQLTHVFRHLLK